MKQKHFTYNFNVRPAIMEETREPVGVLNNILTRVLLVDTRKLLLSSTLQLLLWQHNRVIVSSDSRW